jgi:hypothetical protein
VSESMEGPGWWQASDGRWYAPELHPSYRARGGQESGGSGGQPVRAQGESAAPAEEASSPGHARQDTPTASVAEPLNVPDMTQVDRTHRKVVALRSWAESNRLQAATAGAALLLVVAASLFYGLGSSPNGSSNAVPAKDVPATRCLSRSYAGLKTLEDIPITDSQDQETAILSIGETYGISSSQYQIIQQAFSLFEQNALQEGAATAHADAVTYIFKQCLADFGPSSSTAATSGSSGSSDGSGVAPGPSQASAGASGQGAGTSGSAGSATPSLPDQSNLPNSSGSGASTDQGTPQDGTSDGASATTLPTAAATTQSTIPQSTTTTTLVATVPDVVGMQGVPAEYDVTSAGLSAQLQIVQTSCPNGSFDEVVSQSVPAGTQVPYGTAVTLDDCVGPPPTG